MTLVRRLVPYLLLPLSLIACALASAPWLRAYPSAIISVPLFGAALLSVLTPVVVNGIGVRRLWQTALIDVALLVFYELLVTLREPAGFGNLYDGLLHGPSQILTFALPLVSPRSLLVAPVALCWLGGAIVGECLARAWQTVLPYAALLAVFALAYAGSARAITSAEDGRRYDTVLAAALLGTLLLLRAAQAWVTQDEAAEATQPEGILPLRGLAIGAALAVVVAVVAAGLAQSSAFSGAPTAPARKPPIDRSKPLTPLSFTAGQRTADPKRAKHTLFTLTTDRASSSYVSIASVDNYDGAGWNFDRTFRPSGGVIPSDQDPALRPVGKAVTQQYSITAGPLASSPWMPFLYRPGKVTGVPVNIDAGSGMIVPARRLRAADSYTVRSAAATTPFARLKADAVPAGYAPANLQVPASVASALRTLVDSLAAETKTPSSPAVPFLQAVANDFRTSSGLAGAPSASISASPSGGATSSAARPAASTSPSPSLSAGNPRRAGGTSFADVLASIRQFRSATPEQYATLTCLVARQVGVPSRVVTGYRIVTPNGSSTLPAGRYRVTSVQAWTWVEVAISGTGWVVLDPSPSRFAVRNPPPDNGATPSPTPTVSPTRNAQITPANDGRAAAPKSSTPGAHPLSSTSVVLIVLLAVFGSALLLVAFLLLRRRLRVRRRRRRGDPRRRLLGAWQESLDILEEVGLPDLTYLSSREVTAATDARFGEEPAAQVRYLGEAANVAIFRPSSRIAVEGAEAAWRAHVVLRRQLRRRLGWRQRVGAELRYHRPSTARRARGLIRRRIAAP